MRDKPPDVMHLYGAGLTRIEGAHCIEILFKEGAGLAVAKPWDKLNANIISLNRSLPRGKRIPKLYPQVYLLAHARPACLSSLLPPPAFHL